MFFDVFSALCKRSGLSRNAAAKQIGLSNSTVTKWRNTGATPSGATLAKIADFFGVNVDDLLGMTAKGFLLATENQLDEAKKQYEKETDAEKRMELGLQIDVLQESYNDQLISIKLSESRSKSGKRVDLSSPEIANDTVQMPVIGGVAAGYERIAYEDWTGDSLEIPRSYLRGRDPKDYFVLRVKGDSMFPTFENGDHVLVLRQDTMDRSGQIGVVIYGDEHGTLKRVEYVQGEDWMILRPINPNFPPVTIRGEELEHCKVLGIAKMVIRELDQ